MRIRQALALNKGYTLIEAILALAGLALLLSLSPLVITTVIHSPEEDVIDPQEVELFFTQVGLDIRDSVELSGNDEVLKLEKSNGDIVSIERLVNNKMRRELNNGHEELLYNVSEFDYEMMDRAVKIIVTGKKGQSYERILSLVATN